MIDAAPADPFTCAEALAVLREACEAAALRADGAGLLRLGENAIFRLAHDCVVVRIARGLDVLPDARKEIVVAAWLADAGLPATQTVRVSQPLIVRGRPVTFWQLIDESGTKATPAELGAILRRLHALHVPDGLRLPELEIFGRVAGRIAAARIPDADRSFLADRLGALRAQYQNLGFALKACAVHGDAHQGNLIRQPDGTAVLIDLERFAFGQPEADLSVTATEHLLGWHTREQYAGFVRAYGGYDVMTWPGFPVIRAINELKMTTWLMQNIGQSERTATEFRTRLGSLRDPGRPRRWEPF